MHFRDIFPVLAVVQAVVASPCGFNQCAKNACLNDLLADRPVAKADCQANLIDTASGSVSIVYQTTTIDSIPTDIVSATATTTVQVGATDISSVIETDVVDYTATVVQSDVATATEQATVTVTASVLSPAKRDVGIAIPQYASGCTNDAQYISACSCIGVLPATTTGAASLSTSYITEVATESADVIVTTVETAAITITTSTVETTETISTEILSQAVETIVDTVTYSTETVTYTSTATVAPAAPTVQFQLMITGSGDPSLASTGGVGYAGLTSFRGSTTVFYVTVGSGTSAATTFGIPGTGDTYAPLIAITGPGSAPGEGAYYSTFGGLAPASYINISPESFATSQGGQALMCMLDSSDNVSCQWDSGQVADIWTCDGRINMVRPGYDFSNACSDARVSYKISLTAVNVVIP